MPDFFNNNWTTTRTDAHGTEWVFLYRGGTSIKIRPQGSRAGDWTHGILLIDDGVTPSTVTERWLRAAATRWIRDRRTDPAETRTIA